MQSWVYSENRVGLSTQPCGEPVLSVMVEERWGPSLTVYVWFVRKSLIQVQVWVQDFFHVVKGFEKWMNNDIINLTTLLVSPHGTHFRNDCSGVYFIQVI